MDQLHTILWENRAQANYDCCTLLPTEAGFQLQGMAILKQDNLPMRVLYQVDSDTNWQTRSVHLTAWRGDHQATLTLRVDADQRWWQDDTELSDFRGLVDVDLGFTPATNTLPIRRLALAEPQSAETITVWVQFPTLEITRFPQRYTRTGADTYRFESLLDSFTAVLRVDAHGLVTDYEYLWKEIGYR